mgnify:CR=1 FL=1
MKTPLLNYYKTILAKVSFDRELFSREYDKAIKYLNTVEVEDLNRWIQKEDDLKKLIGKLDMPIGNIQHNAKIESGHERFT